MGQFWGRNTLKMANQKTSMNKLRQVLRFKIEGISKREISKRTGLSRNTIEKYLLVLGSQSYSEAELLQLEDIELEQLVETPVVVKPEWEKLYGVFPRMESELKRVGMTRRILWECYKKEHSSGVQYSQFCEHFNRYLSQQRVSYVFEHKAGDKAMVDFAGKKLHLVDSQTGELIPVEFFVGILACSGLTFAKACMSQQTHEFLGCLSDFLGFVGGVPAALVCDNLKPAVTRASKYDPTLNRSMADFGEHYQTAILPTRAHKPKDKALVENAVHILYTRVYAPLHNRVFHSLSELNAAIAELVDKHNRTKFQNRSTSRQEEFESIERQALRSLPDSSFELKKYQQARVHPNCHVLLSEDKHHYSVPYTYVGKAVSLAYSSEVVEIFVGYERIATHKRLAIPHRYTTIESHLHPNHRYYRNWSAEYFSRAGTQIGPNTELLISQILRQGKHPEQGFKLCQGVLDLARKHGNALLDEAAGICLEYDWVSYSRLENILGVKVDAACQQQQEGGTPLIPIHENLRGSQYYQ
jgi:transposase